MIVFRVLNSCHLCYSLACNRSREGAGSNAVIIDDGLEVIRRIAESAVGESSVPVVTERTEALSLSPSVSGGPCCGLCRGHHPVCDSSACAGPSLPPQHMIVIDVDCKDSSSGMPFPPKVCHVVAGPHLPLVHALDFVSQEFVTPAFLATTRSALAPGGVLVLNVASRAKGLFNSVLEDIKSVFPCVLDVPPVVSQVCVLLSPAYFATRGTSPCVSGWHQSRPILHGGRRHCSQVSARCPFLSTFADDTCIEAMGG